jgi:diguanylate cyclase (GGDEF)-like protein/PAS domain S-box-containing protein
MNPSPPGPASAETMSGPVIAESDGFAQLRQSEAQLRLIVDMVQEAIQLWDTDGRQVFANPATASLFGWREGDAASFAEGQFSCNCLHEGGSPFRPEELPVARVLASRRPVANVVMELLNSDGSHRWIRVNGQPIWSADGCLSGVVTSATDVTELVEHEHRLKHLAHYDALTHLPNRVLMAERMRLTLARAQRTGELVAVCLIDLDGFKPVNDSFGHKAGDQLLREVSRRLEDCIRADDTAARLGGDEFALLLCGLKKLAECEQALTRILTALARPYQVGGQTVRISASIGVTLYPDDGGDPDLLLRHADQAMYQAKQSGKNRFQLFDPGQAQRVQANQGTLRKIEKGLATGQFVLCYQPKVDCRRGRIEGVEALIRWKHPILGTLSPAEFLPLIEQDDLIVTLGDWVIAEALRQVEAWHQAGINLKVSVNVSARQLHQRDFVARLRALLAGQPEGAAEHIEIEVVETAALEDVNAVGDAIRECQEIGVTVALDDFGTGYSSLVHLKRLAADVLKIDQTFVLDMLADAEDLAIVEGVIGLAAAFKRQVVAEGVESIDHVLLLLELGCDVMQGYGLARPMLADQLAEWVTAFVPDPLWNLSSSPRPSRDYFELLLAEANHRAWVDQVVGQARQSVGESAVQMPDDRSCRFGRWYYDEGYRRFQKFEEFRAIEKIHHAVHVLADQLCGDYRDQQTEKAAAGEAMLVDEHRRMAALLRRLRIKLAQEMRGEVH